MTTKTNKWQDHDHARRYAGQSTLISRFTYGRFASQIVAHLAPSLQSPTVVDLGSGAGLLSLEILRLRPDVRVVNVDPSAEMLECAGEKARSSKAPCCEMKLGAAENIPLEDVTADLVISQSSFHEWQDTAKGISEVHRVLKPGGCVVIKDYNLGWLSGWKRKILGSLHHLHMFRYGPGEVAELLRSAGFTAIGTRGGSQYIVWAKKPA